MGQRNDEEPPMSYDGLNRVAARRSGTHINGCRGSMWIIRDIRRLSGGVSEPARSHSGVGVQASHLW